MPLVVVVLATAEPIPIPKLAATTAVTTEITFARRPMVPPSKAAVSCRGLPARPSVSRGNRDQTLRWNNWGARRPRHAGAAGVRRLPSVAAHLGPELVEAHRAEVEGVAVPVLEVERGAPPAPGVLPALQPAPFPDLVRDRLAGEAQVAVDLR